MSNTVRVNVTTGTEIEGLMLTPQLHDQLFSVGMSDEEKAQRMLTMLRNQLSNFISITEDMDLAHAAQHVTNNTPQVS